MHASATISGPLLSVAWQDLLAMHMLQLQGPLPGQANSHTYSMGVLYLPAYRVQLVALQLYEVNTCESLVRFDRSRVPGEESLRITIAQTLRALYTPQV